MANDSLVNSSFKEERVGKRRLAEVRCAIAGSISRRPPTQASTSWRHVLLVLLQTRQATSHTGGACVCIYARADGVMYDWLNVLYECNVWSKLISGKHVSRGMWSTHARTHAHTTYLNEATSCGDRHCRMLSSGQPCMPYARKNEYWLKEGKFNDSLSIWADY